MGAPDWAGSWCVDRAVITTAFIEIVVGKWGWGTLGWAWKGAWGGT